MKLAEVMQIFHIGDKQVIHKYRPMSLLPAMIKTLKEVFFNIIIHV